MMLRRETVQTTGLFDERYFMFCEEIDWAWRIHQAGFMVMCVPAAHVTHLSGQSTGQTKPKTVVHLWTSRLQLFQKFYPAWKFYVAKKMIVIGMKRQLRKLDYTSADTDALVKAYQEVISLAQK